MYVPSSRTAVLRLPPAVKCNERCRRVGIHSALAAVADYYWIHVLASSFLVGSGHGAIAVIAEQESEEREQSCKALLTT